MSTGLAGDELGADHHKLAGGAEDVTQALLACDLPFVVWQLPAGVVQISNRPAADLVGLPLDPLGGAPATDLVGPPDAVRRAIDMIATGQFDDTHGARWVREPDGTQRPVRVWSR